MKRLIYSRIPCQW